MTYNALFCILTTTYEVPFIEKKSRGFEMLRKVATVYGGEK